MHMMRAMFLRVTGQRDLARRELRSLAAACTDLDVDRYELADRARKLIEAMDRCTVRITFGRGDKKP